MDDLDPRSGTASSDETELATIRPHRRPGALRFVVLEAALVVFGVVVALLANEWRQAAVDRRRGQEALRSIRDELMENRSTVVASRDYHARLTDTLRKLFRASEAGRPVTPPDPRTFSRGYIHPATLLSAAWELSGTTDARRHIPYEPLLAISRMYAQQERYEIQAREGGQVIFGYIFEHGHQGVTRNYANLYSIILAFQFRECELLRDYATALATIGEAPEGPGPGCEAMLGIRR